MCDRFNYSVSNVTYATFDHYTCDSDYRMEIIALYIHMHGLGEIRVKMGILSIRSFKYTQNAHLKHYFAMALCSIMHWIENQFWERNSDLVLSVVIFACAQDLFLPTRYIARSLINIQYSGWKNTMSSLTYFVASNKQIQ